MDSKIKWNAKYRDRINELREPAPNPRLLNLAARLTGGIALDLACGLGGNTLLLARRNYQVQAMDISDVAINYIHKQAATFNLPIHPIVADLTDIHNLGLKPNSFDLVVVAYYLDRKLFPIVKSIVRENGYFFMETYYQSPQTNHQGVSNQYKLQPGELLNQFGNWTVDYFNEDEKEGKQTIFCQK